MKTLVVGFTGTVGSARGDHDFQGSRGRHSTREGGKRAQGVKTRLASVAANLLRSKLRNLFQSHHQKRECLLLPRRRRLNRVCGCSRHCRSGGTGLSEPSRHKGAAYELTGAEALSMTEVAAVLSFARGYVHLPLLRGGEEWLGRRNEWRCCQSSRSRAPSVRAICARFGSGLELMLKYESNE